MNYRADRLFGVLPNPEEQHKEREETAVGDLNSNEKGSGARKNEGKTPVHFVPLRYWLQVWEDREVDPHFHYVMSHLACWQERRIPMVKVMQSVSYGGYLEACHVFDFGAKKYKAWNWAKGMQWEVPVGCIIRHMNEISKGEDIDQDSGHSHWGHVVCNLIMLDWYESNYKEGDDRPPSFS